MILKGKELSGLLLAEVDSKETDPGEIEEEYIVTLLLSVADLKMICEVWAIRNLVI